MTTQQMNEADAKFQARFDDEWLDEHGELTLKNYLILSEQYNAKIKEHHEDGTYLLCKNNATGEVFEFHARVFSSELRQILFPKRAYIEPLIIDDTNDDPFQESRSDGKITTMTPTGFYLFTEKNFKDMRTRIESYTGANDFNAILKEEITFETDPIQLYMISTKIPEVIFFAHAVSTMD